MVKEGNLSPKRWSEVLSDNLSPLDSAKRIQESGYHPWSKVLLKLTEDSKEILDLGCGRCQHLAVLALDGKKTTALDWSQDNLHYCHGLFSALSKRSRFVLADMTKPLNFKDRSFDSVFSCGVFEYFTDSQIESILKEAFRIARKRVIILVPNAYSIPYRIGMWYMRLTKQWDWGGERPFATLKPHFNAVGVRKVTEFTVAAKHSLNFLKIPGGRTLQKAITKVFGLTDHANPSLLRQGYLLVTVGEKEQ